MMTTNAEGTTMFDGTYGLLKQDLGHYLGA